MNSESPNRFLDRLKETARRAGGPDALAVKSNTPRRTLANYLSGRNDPKRTALEAIASAGGVSIEWLVTGRGEIESAVAESERFVRRATDAVILRSIERGGKTSLSESFVLVPRYDARASAGPGAIADYAKVTEMLAFRRDWLERTGLKEENIGCLDVVGYSMEPEIPNGATVLFDRSDREPRGKAVFVVRVDDALKVKYAQKLLAGVELRGAAGGNDADPELIPREEQHRFEVIGRVRWVGRVI
jgi:phage repressor protein C with HTH and peptisase S24 domain